MRAAIDEAAIVGVMLIAWVVVTIIQVVAAPSIVRAAPGEPAAEQPAVEQPAAVAPAEVEPATEAEPELEPAPGELEPAPGELEPAPGELEPSSGEGGRPSAKAGQIGEAAVARVRVDLTVWRGGDRLPEGDRIPRRRAVVDGRATYELREPARAGQRIVLLDYAEVLRDEPTHLDEIAMSTYVAGISERARTLVSAVAIDGQAVTARRSGARRDIVVELPAGARTIEIRYRVEVPHRYWPMGCVWQRCSLSGAIAPLPSEPARGGVWLPTGGRVITPVEWIVERARFGAVPSWQPGTEPTPEEDEALHGQELIVTSEAIEPRAPIAYPSLFWGPRWQHTQRWHRGVRIRVLHINTRPGARYPDEHILHPIRDVAGHVVSIAEDAIDIAGAVGIEPPPDAVLTVVQGPIRSDVSMAHPTAIMVSDQYLELLATKRLAKFHDIQVARSLCDALAYSHVSGRHDPSTDLWLHGALGVVLTRLWQRARELRDEYAGDLLAAWTFIPAVDSFLYTGQAAFSSAYFRGSEDQWPVRHHPLFFANELPSGRRIHEKLSDILDEREIAAFYEDVAAAPDGDPRLAAERAWGRDLGWFFDQWLGPYPEVDYSIADVRSTRLDGGRWHHEITVVRDGDRPLVEPIQLYVVERGGADHYLVWNGEAAPGEPLLEQPILARHVFELDTERRLESVRLDPRARLVETSRTPTSPQNRGDNNDPLFNNRDPAKARFVYRGFGLEIAASEFATAQTPQARVNAITGWFVFEASLRRDLRRNFTFNVSTTPETIVGGGARMNFGFGPKRNRQRRALSLSAGANVAWLNRSGLDMEGGMRLVESVSVSHSTRKFGGWPERGHVLAADISAAQTVRLDGAKDHRYALTLGAGWTQLWPLAHHHVLATLLDAAIVLPLASDLEFRTLIRGGGEAGLLGFTSNELFGRAMVRALAEYRHVIIDDLRIPLLNLVFVRTLSGALFGGVASIANCDDYGGLFGAQSWHGQIGYGLAARMQWLGVAPQLIRVNVAVPLGRRTGRQCLGETLPDYIGEVQGVDEVERLLPPVNIFVTYGHLF